MDSFYKWCVFDLKVTTEEAQLAEELINDARPDKIRCDPKAEKYLTDTKVKVFFYDLKKKVTYNY